MKVKAKKRGFFGGILYAPNDGKVFEVTDKQFSEIWMEKVDLRKGKKAKEVKKVEENAYQPLEIPSLMPEFSPAVSED